MESNRMTPKQAGDYLGLSTRTLANMRSQGTGPAYMKPWGRVYYQKVYLDAFLAKGFRPAGMSGYHEWGRAPAA